MTDQNSQFFAILTAIGEAKQANADALGVPWTFSHMGVGDANGTDPIPDRLQTSLINERRKAPLNQLKVDPNNASIIIAEQVIPPDAGGWWIREIGLYDADGDLVAVANCAPSFKPLLSQGTGKTQVVRLNLIVTSTANVTLKIDPAVVLATREYVTEELAKRDFKHSVLVATTSPINLSGLQTVDGVSLLAGARVLVKHQANAKDNGLYIAATGAWSRSADADTSAKVTPGLLVLVERGAANGDSAWQLVTDAPIALGVTALAFEMAFGRTGVAAGTYRSVTVDTYGRVVSATNPTTVAGYGLTDVLTTTQVNAALALKAPLASPTLTGVPSAPTAPTGTNSTQLASTAFVQAALAALVGSSPAALDTLNELAAALGNDPNFATTMTNALAGKVNVADKASQLVAETGSDNAKWMTALGVLQSVMKRLNACGLAANTAPNIGTFLGNKPGGLYIGFGEASGASATPGAPPGSATNVLGVLAINPRADVTYYFVFENGATSGARRFWVGQYNNVLNETYWSRLLSFDQIATQAQVDQGVASDVIVTPKTLSNGVLVSPGLNGFEVKPKWLGGGIKQWGRATLTRDDQYISFPMGFPNSIRTVQVTSVDVNERLVGFGGPTKTGFVAQGYLWGGLTADGNMFVKRASAEVEIMWFAEGD